MCGICGICPGGEAREATADIMRRMIGVMLHRGPDETGMLVGCRVGLGSARLSILDLVGGQQPISNERKTIWVVLNGEIFNYRELKRELCLKGHGFATESDTEVIAHLYEEYKTSFVERLNGDFAFALWDDEDETLVLARDRIGVRPLFYAEVADRLVFASEIKAIQASGMVDLSFDPLALDEIFTCWSMFAPRTAFSGVSQLPPGHLAIWRAGRLTTRSYWELDGVLRDSEPLVARPEDLAESVVGLLRDACTLRLRADVPVGLYLSGGFDSSLLAAILTDTVGRPPTTFSVAFDRARYDESPYQGDVVEALGVDHRTLHCSAEMIGDAFEAAMWHIESPVLRTAPVPMFLLSRLVRDTGVKVVLTGEGADEMWGGYDIFKEAEIRYVWAQRPGDYKLAAPLLDLYPYLPLLREAAPQFAYAVFSVGLDEPEHEFFSHMPRWGNTARLKGLFSREFRNLLAGENCIERLYSQLSTKLKPLSLLRRAQYLEVRTLLEGYSLSSQGDRMMMANSVEGRFPYLDPRLIDLSCRIDDRLKLREMEGKYLLKLGGGRLIPPAVVRRAKQPFLTPMVDAFFREPSVEYVEDAFSEQRLKQTGIFDPHVAGSLLKRVRMKRDEDLISTLERKAMVGVLSTQILFRQFIEGDRPSGSRPSGLPGCKIEHVV